MKSAPKAVPFHNYIAKCTDVAYDPIHLNSSILKVPFSLSCTPGLANIREELVTLKTHKA